MAQRTDSRLTVEQWIIPSTCPPGTLSSNGDSLFITAKNKNVSTAWFKCNEFNMLTNPTRVNRYSINHLQKWKRINIFKPFCFISFVYHFLLVQDLIFCWFWRLRILLFREEDLAITVSILLFIMLREDSHKVSISMVFILKNNYSSTDRRATLNFWSEKVASPCWKEPRIESWFHRCRHDLCWTSKPSDVQLIGNPCKGAHIRFYFTVSFMRET